MNYKQGRQSLISFIRPSISIRKRTESLRDGSQHNARQVVVYSSHDPAVCSCLCLSHGKCIAANEEVGVEGVAASTGRQIPLPSVNKRDLVSSALSSCSSVGEARLTFQVPAQVINQTPYCPVFLMIKGGYIILRAVKFSFSCNY